MGLEADDTGGRNGGWVGGWEGYTLSFDILLGLGGRSGCTPSFDIIEDFSDGVISENVSIGFWRLVFLQICSLTGYFCG